MGEWPPIDPKELEDKEGNPGEALNPAQSTFDSQQTKGVTDAKVGVPTELAVEAARAQVETAKDSNDMKDRQEQEAKEIAAIKEEISNSSK